MVTLDSKNSAMTQSRNGSLDKRNMDAEADIYNFSIELSEETLMDTTLVKMGKNIKRIAVMEWAVENEKYGFMCFLLHLGFIQYEDFGI